MKSRHKSRRFNVPAYQDLLDHRVLQGHKERPDYQAQHVNTRMPTVLVTQEKTGMRMAYVMQTIAKVLPALHL